MLRLPLLVTLWPLARRAWSVAEPAGRISVSGAPPPGPCREQDGLTILSANLWHDWPRFRRIQGRLEDFARLIEAAGADVVLLQEVLRKPDFWADHWLAERLGMAHIYSRVNGHSAGIGFEEGLAILSRYPLLEPRLRRLGCTCNPFVRRLALGAEVAAPCGRMMAFSVHLGLPPWDNQTQLAHLQDWVRTEARETPALIGGDFNAGENRPSMRRARTAWLDTFRTLNPHADGTTHRLSLPWIGTLHESRLDYIFLQPGQEAWRIADARRLIPDGDHHSDHHPVLAHLIPNLSHN